MMNEQILKSWTRLSLPFSMFSNSFITKNVFLTLLNVLNFKKVIITFFNKYHTILFIEIWYYCK